MLWMAYGHEGVGNIDGYHPNIYDATLGRFDEFLPGIATTGMCCGKRISGWVAEDR